VLPDVQKSIDYFKVYQASTARPSDKSNMKVFLNVKGHYTCDLGGKGLIVVTST